MAALACRPVDRPPLWLMRQAGRSLPEYRALKERHTFLELVREPDLATEVTLQPVRRFGFDAAILFSDILVVPEAMGQAYRFREAGGIEMDFAVRTITDVNRLDPRGVREKLDYGARALRSIRKELAGRTALLGFAGAPWTLANFMAEGGSAPAWVGAMRLFREDSKAYGRLMEKLCDAVVEYLELQIEAGADAVQIFDTLGHLLPVGDYEEASGRWITEIVGRLERKAPVIVFAKGVNDCWPVLLKTGANAFSVDASVSLPQLRAELPANVAVQGNLAPELLLDTPERVADATRELLVSMRGARGHIANLGHGVLADARLDSIGALAETVRTFS